MMIPGQSLTSEPKNAPYENPPEMTNPDDVVFWHLDSLSEPDKLEALLDAMELGLDVVTLTEGILRGAVAEGRHTIDVSLIVAPVVHEFIKTTADKAGIDYEEGLPADDKEERLDIKYKINEHKARKMIAEFEGKEEEEDMEEAPMEAAMPVQDEPTVDEETPAASAGLMSRPSNLEGDV